MMNEFKYDYQCPVIMEDQIYFWDTGASWGVTGWMFSAYLHSWLPRMGEIAEKAPRHPGVPVTKAIGHKTHKSSQQPGTLPKNV